MSADARRNALDRGLEILGLLSSAGPLNFSAIARQTGAAHTVIARLLRSLVSQGWVEHQVDGRYAPGQRLRQFSGPQDFLPAAQAVLNALRDVTACTCLLLVEEQGSAGPYIRCLAKAGHEDGLGMQEVGAIRTSYLSHPWSWIFLDRHPKDRQADLLASEEPLPCLRRAWQDGLIQLRQQGCCQLQGDSSSKWAVPVCSEQDGLLAAIGLGWPGQPPRGAQKQRLQRAMLSAASELARVLASH